MAVDLKHIDLNLTRRLRRFYFSYTETHGGLAVVRLMDGEAHSMIEIFIGYAYIAKRPWRLV